MAKQAYDFDLLVIGGGSGGYAAARTAKAAGMNVGIVDGAEQLGGLCILRGCMPTKALLYATDVLHLARKASTWGIEVPQVTPDLSRVMARKAAMIQEFAKYRVEQLERYPLFRSKAKFLDSHRVILSDGKILSAKHFLISTGSKVSDPPIPALQTAGYITSDDALELGKIPESILVLGGGPVALEFAQFFARMGSRVTIVQRSKHILRDFDEDIAEELTKAFREEGLEVIACTTILDVKMENGKKFIFIETPVGKLTLSAEEIFYGLGRSPNTGELDLDKAGVRCEKGRIVADGFMQTSAPHIYAAGDCTGPYEIVHVAIQQGETAVANMLDPRSKPMGYHLLLSVVFTDPQVAYVGMTEKECRDNNISCMAASYPFNDHGKSMIMDIKHGFVKVIAESKTGEILGGAVVGPHGGELIHEIVAAMHKRMTVQELATMPHYHPTLAEIWTYPAEEIASQLAV